MMSSSQQMWNSYQNNTNPSGDSAANSPPPLTLDNSTISSTNSSACSDKINNNPTPLSVTSLIIPSPTPNGYDEEENHNQQQREKQTGSTYSNGAAHDELLHTHQPQTRGGGGTSDGSSSTASSDLSLISATSSPTTYRSPPSSFGVGAVENIYTSQPHHHHHHHAHHQNYNLYANHYQYAAAAAAAAAVAAVPSHQQPSPSLHPGYPYFGAFGEFTNPYYSSPNLSSSAVAASVHHDQLKLRKSFISLNTIGILGFFDKYKLRKLKGSNNI